MKNTICKNNLHLVLFFLSLFLLWLKITAATPLGHQLVEEGGGATNFKCSNKERDALLHFKSYIHQDPKDRLSTWTTEEANDDCCKWKGVTCNNHSRVTILDLGFGDLRGEISPSLLNLTYLHRLDLLENYFNGAIPVFIGSMTQLRHLDLSSNDFTGTIPPELGNLTNLQELSLGYLGGCTVENLNWVSQMSHLETLFIGDISLSKVNDWVNVILSLKKLSDLFLYGCNLSHVVHPYSYSYFNSSSSIARLGLTDNNLNSSMYYWLFPLTSNRLVNLDLSRNKLDGIPEYFGNLCSLETLHFEENSIPVIFSDFMNKFSGCTSVNLQELYAQSSLLIGAVSDDIRKFPSLQTLDLSYNQLNGTISEKVWQLPKLQYLDVSFNSLTFSISQNTRNFENLSMDLSESSLTFVMLSSCILGPVFPKWIQTLKNLVYLDISNTGISDMIPMEFWKVWPYKLAYLSLSSNNITGNVTDLISSFDIYDPIIDLSYNNFYGPIPNVPSNIQILDLSNNKLCGGIYFLCEIANGSLTSLDLSNNSLTGPIPDCMWHFGRLQVLNLGQNNFSGRLPASIEYLISLEALYLYNNNFSGELPLSLQSCTNLTFLHLGANKFSGPVPIWIGEKFSGLYAFSLKSNNFYGTIPLELCYLVNLQILDLSMNNLVGTIPSCLNNITTMVQNGSSIDKNVHHYSWGTFTSEYDDHAMIQWQGSAREFSSTLGLLKSIDLSCNNLEGYIPFELMDLHELIAMNLSNNVLLGEIPQKIGQMVKLLILDLSSNNLTGRIPSSMSQMTLLSYLDVSHNNLFGRIPSSTQLQSFEPSRYTGNPRLCGLPLTKYCPGDKQPHVDRGEGGDDDMEDLRRWFYIGGASGFATGFWIACWALLVNLRGRNAFFHFLDGLKDWAYVKTMTSIAKLQRAKHP